MVHRGGPIHAEQHHRRIETERRERTDRHAMVAPGVVARRDDGDARGEPPEHTAERVGIDHHGKIRTPKTLQINAARMTSRGGTKLPVTPISRSARSLRLESDRAARLMSGAEPTTAPITRS